MKRSGIVLMMLIVALAASLGAGEKAAPAKAAPEWSVNMTIMEACTCPMFCQCFFNETPASHHDHATGKSEHYCKGNLAYRVNSGHYGDVELDGALFWGAGDVGGSFADGFEWMVLTFDPSVTKAQREGIAAILGHVYPLPVKEMKVAPDAKVEWKPGKDRAVATLDGGKAGEIVLKRFQGMTDEPIVVRNLKYIGAPRNDGFLLMPNEVQAYRVGDRAFESRNTNGFMVTIDMSSKDVVPKPAG